MSRLVYRRCYVSASLLIEAHPALILTRARKSLKLKTDIADFRDRCLSESEEEEELEKVQGDFLPGGGLQGCTEAKVHSSIGFRQS